MTTSFFGYRRYPAPLVKPARMFIVGGIITWGLVFKARQAMMAAAGTQS
jgi:hypothetical protein